VAAMLTGENTFLQIFDGNKGRLEGIPFSLKG
jgi:hypothetical protein